MREGRGWKGRMGWPRWEGRGMAARLEERRGEAGERGGGDEQLKKRGSTKGGCYRG